MLLRILGCDGQLLLQVAHVLAEECLVLVLLSPQLPLSLLLQFHGEPPVRRLDVGHAKTVALLVAVEQQLLPLVCQLLVLQRLLAVDEHAAADALQLYLLLLLHIVTVCHLAHGILVGECRQPLLRLGLGRVVGFLQAFLAFVLLLLFLLGQVLAVGEEIHLVLRLLHLFLRRLYLRGRGTGVAAQVAELLVPFVELPLPVGECVVAIGIGGGHLRSALFDNGLQLVLGRLVLQ